MCPWAVSPSHRLCTPRDGDRNDLTGNFLVALQKQLPPIGCQDQGGEARNTRQPGVPKRGLSRSVWVGVEERDLSQAGHLHGLSRSENLVDVDFEVIAAPRQVGEEVSDGGHRHVVPDKLSSEKPTYLTAASSVLNCQLELDENLARQVQTTEAPMPSASVCLPCHIQQPSAGAGIIRQNQGVKYA